MTHPDTNPVIDLQRAFDGVTEHWSPKVLAQVNDQYVKVAKVQGQFDWHSHAHEDELFYVLRGRLTIHYEGERQVEIGAGAMHVVPRGVLHRPVAEEECWIVLVETVTTLHSGDIDTPLTKTIAQQLA